MKLNKTRKDILKFLQGDIPVEDSPYSGLAQAINTRESCIVKEIALLKKHGYIRRLGAVLHHRNIGLKVNCMCAWKVPHSLIKKISGISVRQKEISHCYLRKTAKNWPYNFYIMIHGKSKRDCINVVENIRAKSGVADYRLLFTKKEFKKISPKYKF
ncbi:MAG: Lrp/AsnC family transcriptional regulator [Candidatus Omnitrophica bacterium]|nr:Lrp/AsnC family transcriptional regulator [Candidatus Omnitrophota bacterium]